MRGVIYGAAGKWPAGVIIAAAGQMPPAAEAAKQAAHAAACKGYKTCEDITLESIIEGLRELKRTDPAEYRRQKRINRAYSEGDFDLALTMDEGGVGEHKARSMLSEDAYWENLERTDPAEFAFQGVIRDWAPHLKKRLKEGEVSFEVIQSSPTPVYTLEAVPQSHWPRFQAWVKDNAPWKTEGQRGAYERGYCERQRAIAIRLFSGFGPKRRAEHWRCWWRNETPAKQSWWHCRDPKKWTIWRAELARQIAADREASQ